MRAIAYLASNQNEIIQAEKLGIKVPEPIIVEVESLFPVTAILFAFNLVESKKIRCVTTLGGMDILLKYEEDVWKRIESHLQHA